MDIKEKLKQCAIAAECGTEDSDLEEFIKDADEVWQGELDVHRWCYYQSRVVKITDDFFVHYVYGAATGDGDSPDFEWDSVYEVKPVEKMTIVYEKV